MCVEHMRSASLMTVPDIYIRVSCLRLASVHLVGGPLPDVLLHDAHGDRLARTARQSTSASETRTLNTHISVHPYSKHFVEELTTLRNHPRPPKRHKPRGETCYVLLCDEGTRPTKQGVLSRTTSSLFRKCSIIFTAFERFSPRSVHRQHSTRSMKLVLFRHGGGRYVRGGVARPVER